MNITNSARQTKRLAVILAKKFSKRPQKNNALIFALTGELGSGKTTFIQGFLRGLGVRKKITSPTFVLIKCYMLHVPCFRNVYHIDCYRIRKASELLKLGLGDILNNPRNIVLIEWAEKIKKILPRDAIWLKFYHGKKINQRIIKIKLP